MKIRSTASLIALTLTLAACGGGAEEADDPVVPTSEGTAVPAAVPVTEPEPAEADAAPAAADGEDEAQPDAAAEAAPAPAPAASARPAAEAAAPAPAVAAPRPPMFAMCAACHAVEPGKNGIGPSLAGVFGAQAGHHVPDFNYSQAMKDSGLTWDEATLHRYLENPRQVVPGTTMAYAGMKNDAQRQAVIDYLKGL